jgi:hypothetical protein
LRIPVAPAAAAIAAFSGDFDRATGMIIVAAGIHAGTFLVRNSDSSCEITLLIRSSRPSASERLVVARRT